jgi:hypothetical protein
MLLAVGQSVDVSGSESSVGNVVAGVFLIAVGLGVVLTSRRNSLFQWRMMSWPRQPRSRPGVGQNIHMWIVRLAGCFMIILGIGALIA